MIMNNRAAGKMQAALDLAELGYAILPCRPNAKRPATAHGLKDATSDVDAIAHFWEKQPDCNPAICTDGILVIDIDPGAAWPNDPDRELELSAAPTAATPRGGRHHFFRDASGELRNTAGKIAEHVDTRAAGGYALVSPSEVDSKPYRWLTPLDCSPHELPTPPDWVLNALRGCDDIGLNVEIPHTLTTHPGASQGRRNAVLCELVGRHLATEGVNNELLSLASAWASRCNPPMPAEQVTKSVQGLIEKHQRSNPPEPKKSAGTSVALRKFSEVTAEPIRWLWDGRIPLGKLSLLTGDPGLGKTTVMMDVAAKVTTGGKFPDGAWAPKGRVLFYSLEDAVSDTLKPRAIAAGADVNLLTEVGAVSRNGADDILQFDRDLPLLRAVLDQLDDVRLLIVDPLSATLGDSVNEHRNADVRRVLGPLSRLADETGIAILGIAHSPKASADRKGVHRTLGSIAFVAAARTAWCVVADPDDDERRLMLPQKNNLANVDGLAFRLQPTTAEGCDVAFVEWEPDPVRMRLDDIDGSNSNGRDSSAFDEATAWLLATITEPVLAEDVIKRAKRDGVSERTLKRAKQSLGIKSQRCGKDGDRGGGEWHWFPPVEVGVGDGDVKGANNANIAIKDAKSGQLGILNQEPERTIL